ncbi:nuclease-related domain-containing protein [Psychrobacillus psychrodurans]|uniref:nuclease-related domain-containing protein n=1 Tax=Psychrobacillus psychrodurans TaxID=126157 RepID=UPI003CFCAF9C
MQIDCVVVTDRCCIVLESKNVSGRLYFNEELDEFYKEENGVEPPFLIRIFNCCDIFASC